MFFHNAMSGRVRATADTPGRSKPEREPVEAKRCCRCGLTLPAKAFNRNPALRSGLRSSCRKCEAASAPVVPVRTESARERIRARQRGERPEGVSVDGSEAENAMAGTHGGEFGHSDAMEATT